MSTTYTVTSETKIGDELIQSASEAIESVDSSVQRFTLAAGGGEVELTCGTVATIIEADVSAGNSLKLVIGSTEYDLYGFLRIPDFGLITIRNDLTAAVDIKIAILN